MRTLVIAAALLLMPLALSARAQQPTLTGFDGKGCDGADVKGDKEWKADCIRFEREAHDAIHRYATEGKASSKLLAYCAAYARYLEETDAAFEARDRARNGEDAMRLPSRGYSDVLDCVEREIGTRRFEAVFYGNDEDRCEQFHKTGVLDFIQCKTAEDAAKRYLKDEGQYFARASDRLVARCKSETDTKEARFEDFKRCITIGVLAKQK